MFLKLPKCGGTRSFERIPRPRQAVDPVSGPFLCADSSLRRAWNTTHRRIRLGLDRTESYHPVLAIRNTETVAVYQTMDYLFNKIHQNHHHLFPDFTHCWLQGLSLFMLSFKFLCQSHQLHTVPLIIIYNITVS